MSAPPHVLTRQKYLFARPASSFRHPSQDVCSPSSSYHFIMAVICASGTFQFLCDALLCIRDCHARSNDGRADCSARYRGLLALPEQKDFIHTDTLIDSPVDLKSSTTLLPARPLRPQVLSSGRFSCVLSPGLPYVNDS